ncbi:MAG: DUF1844 domain-containing protein [Deferrisomatales bacterium]|nr:DUF1844 domain-containing protein [Deferrisomatales bacterium]
MSDDRSFTVRDRRGVKVEGTSDEGKGTEGPEAGPPESSLGGDATLPPVDFAGFILGLGQTALACLGEIPVPGTGEISVDLEQARHTIDILDMLEAKTQGNLSPDEQRLLRTLEEELKLKYVRLTHKRPV